MVIHAPYAGFSLNWWGSPLLFQPQNHEAVGKALEQTLHPLLTPSIPPH